MPSSEAIQQEKPTFKIGGRCLFVGVWRHRLSIHGWWGRDAGFVARPSRLKTSKGTIQLRPEDVAGIPDEEFRDLDLLRAPLDG